MFCHYNRNNYFNKSKSYHYGKITCYKIWKKRVLQQQLKGVVGVKKGVVLDRLLVYLQTKPSFLF